MTKPNDLISKTAAAKYLGVTPRLLEKLRLSGQVRWHQVDQRIFYSQQELERYAWHSQDWLDSHRVQPKSIPRSLIHRFRAQL